MNDEAPSGPGGPVITYPPTRHRSIPLALLICFSVWWPLCLLYVIAVTTRLFWPRADLAFLEDFAFNWHASPLGSVVMFGRLLAIAYLPVALVLWLPHLESSADPPSRSRRLAIRFALPLVLALFIEAVVRS
jgi:hypothetical protein